MMITEEADRAALYALAVECERLRIAFDGALLRGDRETATRLGGELVTLAGQAVALRLALGEDPGAILELLQKGAAEQGLDLRGMLPGGLQ